MEHKKMRLKKSILLSLILSSLIFTGCATVKDMHESFVESLRKPGETMERSPEETAQFFACSPEKQNLPILFETEVIPHRVIPGKEINNRIRYAFCPSLPPGKQKGELIRTVRYKQRIIFRDKTEYEFKAGTWTVDASITVPDNAGIGDYTVDTIIVLKGKALKKSNAFTVKEQ